MAGSRQSLELSRPSGEGGARDFDYLKAWIASRSPGGAAGHRSRELREEFEQFFTYIFNNSPDGISILDLDFTHPRA